MNSIHFDVRNEIEEAQKSISRRRSLDKRRVPIVEKTRAEQLVCVTSRSLHSRFVDTALWSGIDEELTRGVRETLKQALDCITVDEKCRASVKRRYEEFKKFVKNSPPARLAAA